MIKIENLTVKYSRQDSAVLKNITFFAEKGEKTAIIGANGTGKTTFLLTLAGLLLPLGGTAEVDRIKVEKKTVQELRKKAGLVFQNPDDQLFMPTVYDDVSFGLCNSGCAKEEAQTKTDKILEKLGISALKEKLCHKLSGGEKRLVALAGVLVMEPALLLLDEPSSFLDPRARERIIAVLKMLDHTTIIATHDLDLALDTCPRVVILKDGYFYADGAASTLLTDDRLLKECGLELPLSMRKK